MADDHARPASDGEPESGSNADGPNGSTQTPGGGPKRVVSETSVDDILASIGADEDGTDGADETDRQHNVTEDVDDVAEETVDDVEAGDGAGTETGDGAENADSGVADLAVTVDEDEFDGGASTGGLDANGDAGEGLTERIERGTVTGADVRAAEAGEGREPTPEVDEIDLSLEDLEPTTSTADAGPSDGEGDPSATDDDPSRENDATDDATSIDSDGSSLLDRLKQLFSR